jgi:hypothetical protein
MAASDTPVAPRKPTGKRAALDDALTLALLAGSSWREAAERAGTSVRTPPRRSGVRRPARR